MKIKNYKRGLFALLFIAALAVVALVLTNKTNFGEGQLTLSVISERDSFEETSQFDTDADTLGDFIRQSDRFTWEDGQYGLYLQGVDEMQEDIENEYWWSILVDGEPAVTGADEIVIEADKEYTLELQHGF